MHPRDRLVQTMDRIYRHGLTTSSGGNLSVRSDDDRVWITPAGIDKGRLAPPDIVCVRPDGRVEGERRPSSELPFHLAVYAARADCRAIVHAHPVALVAFSVCHCVPDLALLPLSARRCGRVASVGYELTGTDRLAERIGDAFAAGADAALLENHGVVVGGRDLTDAHRRFDTLERTARIAATAGAIGTARPPAGDMVVPASSDPAPADGRPPNPALAEEVVTYTRRACRQGLMTSASGLISARANDRSIVSVPPDVDREHLDGSDLTTASSADPLARLHHAVHAAHPEIAAVITSDPVHATAFAVAGVTLAAHAVSESLIVVRNVVPIPFALAAHDPARAAAMISPAQPVALLENVGVLAVGRSIHEAFDRLEVVEATAHAILMTRGIGEAVLLGDDDVRALEAKFPVG